MNQIYHILLFRPFPFDRMFGRSLGVYSTNMAMEGNLIIKASPGHFSHVPCIDKQQVVLHIRTGISNRGQDQAIVFSGCVRVRNKDCFGFESKIIIV